MILNNNTTPAHRIFLLAALCLNLHLGASGSHDVPSSRANIEDSARQHNISHSHHNDETTPPDYAPIRTQEQSHPYSALTELADSLLKLSRPAAPSLHQLNEHWATDFSTQTDEEFQIETTTAPLNTNTTENDSPAQNSVHPLLIYSIRYEIRSFDLFNSTSVMPSAQSPTSNLSSANTNSAPFAFYEPHTTFSGRNSKTLIAGLKNTIGLDFYYSEQESFIFWTDVVEERIYKGTISNGTITNVEMLVQSGLATAEGLAVDWIGHNIYWVESTLDHIEVARMNGSDRRTLIAGDMESPRAIAVDPRYGLLFWSDWDKKNPRIERATMSGDERKTLVYIKEVNGSWPNGLTLDYEQMKIYWIDANSDSIHAVDYEGNNHQQILNNIKSLGHPFSITLYENNLYWTDWKTNSVSMANKYNGSDAKELQRLSSRLFDIKVFHPSRQPKIDNRLNPCYLNNGNCSHLCLLTSNHTRKCECPHLMKLSQDDKTCETAELVLLIGRPSEIRVVDMNKPLHHIMAPIVVPKVFNPRQLEFDSKSRYIFWVDAHTNEVKRAQLGGNSVETIIDVIIDMPTGLALDWISGNIYVTSSSLTMQNNTGVIYIANIRGEYISTLMDSSQGIIAPKSIAVHPVLGLLFCIDFNEQFEPIIFAASMDGRHKRIITSKANNPRLVYPVSLAIDYQLNRVYWVNQVDNLVDNPKDYASIQYYDISEDKVVTFLDESTQNERISPYILCIDGDSLIVGGRISTGASASGRSTTKESIIKISNHDSNQRTDLRTYILDQVIALKIYNASSQVGSNACSQNNGGCSQLCVPTNSTNRVCKCTMGYTINPKNETACVGKDLFLIYSYNLGMRGIGIEPGSSSIEHYLPPIHRAFRASSIDYVYRDNLIYWVDNDEGSIARINRDTTNYQTIVQGLESEESICIDWVAGNIYWLDPYYDIIEVARLNGTNRYVIVSGDMDKANGIVVNPISGYIAWSDVGTNPKIETARLDGSNRSIIVSSFDSHVDDLAVDYAADYIYWVDITLAVVERIKPDGTSRQVIYRVPAMNIHMRLVSIALYRDYLYMVHDSGHQASIVRCNKSDGNNLENLHRTHGDAIKDIAIFAEQPIPGPEDNPCVRDNGGCQDLCLFMGIKGNKRCLCSHGKLDQDGLTCKPYDTFVMFAKQSQIDSLHIKDDESPYNSPYKPIMAESRSNIISLTVDYNAGRLIYSELTRDQICSALFNGTDRKVLVEKQSLVEGIAFSNNQLYWTSIQDNSITRYNTTSSGMPILKCENSICRKPKLEKIVKLTQEDKLRGIAVDHCSSRIYWTNWNQNNPSIQRAGPHNGYKVETIIKDINIKVPNGIAIDQERRVLYWCDAKMDKIERSELDGSNRIVLMMAAPQHPFALAVWQDYIFWTDWLAKGVFRADKIFGRNPVQIKKVSQRPMGLAIAAPNDFVCPEVDCSINNGGCPEPYRCYYTTGGNQSTACAIPHELLHHREEETQRPRCHRKDGLCVHSYHDIILDRLSSTSDRYNITNLEPLEFHVNENQGTTENHDIIHHVTMRTQQQQVDATTAIMPRNETPHRNPPLLPDVTKPNTSDLSVVNKRLETTTSVIPIIIEPKTATFAHHNSTTPVTSSKPLPSELSTLINRTTTTKPIEGPSKNISNTTTLQPPTQAYLTNSTAPPPCQTSASKTDATPTSECSLAGQFKCYLSEKLVCIPGDRRCDGVHDCPSKEDENDCYLSKRGPYNLKRETNWHRFVSVILIILAAAVAAMFLVFGTRGRRRWFVGSNGAFNHRRMFDDNGTNIEISNPMFEEDDSGNSNNCTFSIDLNERTTNFSNPLYERQVLLMNDKHVTSN